MSKEADSRPTEDGAKKRREYLRRKAEAFGVIVGARLIHIAVVLIIAWIGIKWLSGLPYAEQVKGLTKLSVLLGFVAVVPEWYIGRVTAEARQKAAQYQFTSEDKELPQTPKRPTC